MNSLHREKRITLTAVPWRFQTPDSEDLLVGINRESLDELFPFVNIDFDLNSSYRLEEGCGFDSE